MIGITGPSMDDTVTGLLMLFIRFHKTDIIVPRNLWRKSSVYFFISLPHTDFLAPSESPTPPTYSVWLCLMAWKMLVAATASHCPIVQDYCPIRRGNGGAMKVLPDSQTQTDGGHRSVAPKGGIRRVAEWVANDTRSNPKI